MMWRSLLGVVSLLLACQTHTAFTLQFTRQPGSVTVAAQGEGVLHCQTDDAFAVIAWLHGNNPLQPKHAEFRYRIHRNGSLLVSAVQYPDFRTRLLDFHCIASNKLGTIVSHPASIAVAYLDPYPTKAHHRQAYGIHGNTALLSCPGFDLVTSRPPAKVLWYRDGRPLVTGRALTLPSGDLQLANYSPQDNGMYQCLLKNAMVTISKGNMANYMSPRVTLTTEKITPVLTFTKLPPSRSTRPITTSVGEDLLIEAAATAMTKPIIMWTKEPASPLPAGRISQIGEGNLRIRAVQESDAGAYRITARAGTEVSYHFINLVVQVVPKAALFPRQQTVRPGATVTLSCSAVNTPYSTIAWYHNGRRQPANSATMTTLRIHSIDVQHDGYYQCVVGNSAGHTMAVARVKVEATPQFSTFPQEQVAVDVRTSFELNCTATGKPLPLIHWLYGDAVIATKQVITRSMALISSKEVKLSSGATGMQSTLHIATALANATGSYRCLATNSLGEKTSSVSEVSVLGAPVLHAVSPQTAVLGEDAELTIRFTGLPVPRVVWKLPSMDKQLEVRTYVDETSGTLSLHDVQLSDAGQYTVGLTNSYGRVSADIILKIITKPQVTSVYSKDDIVVLGNDYWLSCNATGLPLPNVTWYREDFAIPVTEAGLGKYSVSEKERRDSGIHDYIESRLTIHDVRYRDLTIYSCRVQSEAGVATETMTVKYDDDDSPGDGRIGGQKSSGGLPAWKIVLIVVTIALVLIVAGCAWCFALHKRRDRMTIQKLSQPFTLATTIPGMQSRTTERDGGDGEDASATKGTTFQPYAVVVKTLSQPLEPGRGVKSELAFSKSTPPRSAGSSSSPVPAYTMPSIGPPPGPGHNTPQVNQPIIVPTSQAGTFNRDSSQTPVPAARSRRSMKSYSGPDLQQHSRTPSSSDTSSHPVPAQRKNSLESRGGRQAQGRGFGIRSPKEGRDTAPTHPPPPPVREEPAEGALAKPSTEDRQPTDWTDGKSNFSRV